MAYSGSANILSFEAKPQVRPAVVGSSQYRVPIEEILTSAFLGRHCQFESIGTFFTASGLDPQSLVSFDERTLSHWDSFVRAVSKFPSREAMLKQARGEWLLRRIGVAVDA